MQGIIVVVSRHRIISPGDNSMCQGIMAVDNDIGQLVAATLSLLHGSIPIVIHIFQH